MSNIIEIVEKEIGNAIEIEEKRANVENAVSN